VITAYKHDVLSIERTVVSVDSTVAVTPDTTEYYNYVGITGGNITLRTPVVDDSYVWITKAEKLLIPNIDYTLAEDRVTVKLRDYVDIDEAVSVITFGSNILRPGIAYMQFKDMLNREHFKRLSLYKQTRLVQPLKFNDVSIEVDDATNFDEPNPLNNKPGVVEIRGERIEYFQKNGNILSQLRRGTLGTGTPTVHPFGSYVQDIGPSETLPYTNKQVIQQLVSDGSNTVNLNFVPGEFDTTWTWAGDKSKGLISSTEEASSLAKDSIEVFVGGYNTDSDWSSNVDYNVGDIVTVGSYTYRCTTAHTSSTKFVTDYTNWEFFIGNIRLRKNAYSVYNVHEAPDSPEGDID
jgi:hypothetical protein